MLKRLSRVSLLISIVVLLTACQEKPKATVLIDTNKKAIVCIKLNTIGLDEAYIKTLQSLYTFKQDCQLQLSLSYKKNIVCNSTHNIAQKNTGKFPKSFLRLVLKEGFTSKYSYYIDLYDNVASQDVEIAFRRLAKDML